MANDIPGEYDYPMIACGPVSLADRTADPEAAISAVYGERRAGDRSAVPSRVAVGA